jgi:hypothetical protein
MDENEDSGLSSPEPCIPKTEPEPPIDRFMEVKKFITEFDYGVEVFDWECFEEDVDAIKEMDFSQYV